jgi:hypothetical protein
MQREPCRAARFVVIFSDEAKDALFFRPESGVVSNDPAVWIRAVCGLLDNPDRRQSMVDAAYGHYLGRLTITAAADRVDAFLRDILAGRTTASSPDPVTVA